MVYDGDLRVQLIYDPNETDICFLQGVYRLHGLECPSEEKLRSPFSRDGDGELATTTFEPLLKAKAMELADVLLEIGIDVNISRIE